MNNPNSRTNQTVNQPTSANKPQTNQTVNQSEEMKASTTRSTQSMPNIPPRITTQTNRQPVDPPKTTKPAKPSYIQNEPLEDPQLFNTIRYYEQLNRSQIEEIEELKRRIIKLQALVNKRTKLIQSMKEYNEVLG